MVLIEKIYHASRMFPADERFGLTAQIRRAAISITSIIAGGHASHSRKDYARFISIAAGSTAEVETQLLLACKLGFCCNTTMQSTFLLIQEIQSMLFRLRTSLRKASTHPLKPTT